MSDKRQEGQVVKFEQTRLHQGTAIGALELRECCRPRSNSSDKAKSHIPEKWD